LNKGRSAYNGLMKTPAILLVLLLFAVDAAAQTPAGGASASPLQIAQGGQSAPAGSAAAGATLPAAHTSNSSATAAFIGFAVAASGAVGFGSYNNNTASNH